MSTVLLLQVGRDEVYQLQPEFLGILDKWLGHRISLTQCRLGESGPNIIGRVGPHTVLMMKLYADRRVHAGAALLVRISHLCHFCCVLCLAQRTPIVRRP